MFGREKNYWEVEIFVIYFFIFLIYKIILFSILKN